jgi:hypothetical protein
MGNHIFAVYWNTPDDAQRANADPLGFCRCNDIAFKFLDIPEAKEFNGIIQRKGRKAHTRTATRADGTSVKAKEAGAQEGTLSVAESLGSSGTIINFDGALTVTLKTGKKTQAGNNHTLSFTFTSNVARTIIIAEALGEIIPANKMSTTADTNEIFPYFIMPSGARHLIVRPDVAEQRQGVQVGTATELLAALTAKGQASIPAAGGDAPQT